MASPSALAASPASPVALAASFAAPLLDDNLSLGPHFSTEARAIPSTTTYNYFPTSYEELHSTNHASGLHQQLQEALHLKGNGSKIIGNNFGSSPAVHTHVLAQPFASIVGVDESNNVALYAAQHDRWMVDSGATHQMTPYKSDFSSYTQCIGTVKLGDVSSTSQIGVGTIVFKSRQGIKISLSNVLHVPKIATRYLSTHALMEKGAQILMDKGALRVLVNGKCVASGYTEGRLLWIDAAKTFLHTHIKSEVSLHTWHLRMGHMSHNALKYHGPTAITGMDLDVSTSAELPKKVC